jgi:hypothetical protein
MNLTIRALTETDYDNILLGWWKDWNWEAPERDFLPDNGKGGIMVMDGDIPVCAGFMYITNSRASWIDWIISSKTYRVKPNRKEAIKLLVASLTVMTENSGSKYGYALIKNKSLIEVYESLGYIKGDSYTSEMIKKL